MQSGGTRLSLQPKFWPFGEPLPRSACAKPALSVASWPAPAAVVRRPEAFASNATRRMSPNAAMRNRLSRSRQVVSRQRVRCPNRAQNGQFDAIDLNGKAVSFLSRQLPRAIPLLKLLASALAARLPPSEAAAGRRSAGRNVYYRSILPAYNTHVCSSSEGTMRINKFKLMQLRLRKNTKT